MKDTTRALRVELKRIRAERDRLETEVTLWRTRYYELLAQSGVSRGGQSPRMPTHSRHRPVQAIASRPPVRSERGGSGPGPELDAADPQALDARIELR